MHAPPKESMFKANVLLASSLVICALALMSCDVIQAPYAETPEVPDTTDVPDTNTAEVKQMVLLEDFTGHYCGNCPAGTDIIRQLETAYADRLIVIAVHAGNLSLPNPPDFPMDFRTPDGNVLNSTFKNSLIGLPNGFVNRVTVNDGIVLNKDRWAEVVASELPKKPEVDLKVARTYDSTTRTVTLNVNVKYLEAGTANDNIAAVITESKIISDQLDYRLTNSHIDEYEFNHVYRAAVNGPWGEALSATAIAKGTTITKQLTYTLPAGKPWVPANCDVVVYVHRHNTTKQVLQAQQLSLTGN